MKHPYVKYPKWSASPWATTPTSWTVPALCAAYRWPTAAPGGGVIGIIEMAGTLTSADVAAYFKSIGQPAPFITHISADGVTNNGTVKSADADYEVALDVMVAGAAYYAATGKLATIHVYWTSNDMSLAVKAAAKDGCAVFSCSWGDDEAQWATSDMASMNAACQAATAMQVFAAAGDNDAGDGGPHGANVDFPASSPYVCGCGGTTKTTISEVVWNNNPGQLNGEGTGGGFSTVYARPSWQLLPSVATNSRMVPDVAANADPNTGYEIYVHGQSVVVGGTSAVAPLWSGIFAALVSKGAFEVPFFYQHPECFTDITQGDNSQYKAGPGPDPCTGCGVPIGTALLSLMTGTPIPVPPPAPPPPAPPAMSKAEFFHLISMANATDFENHKMTVQDAAADIASVCKQVTG